MKQRETHPRHQRQSCTLHQHPRPQECRSQPEQSRYAYARPQFQTAAGQFVVRMRGFSRRSTRTKANVRTLKRSQTCTRRPEYVYAGAPWSSESPIPGYRCPKRWQRVPRSHCLLSTGVSASCIGGIHNEFVIRWKNNIVYGRVVSSRLKFGLKGFHGDVVDIGMRSRGEKGDRGVKG